MNRFPSRFPSTKLSNEQLIWPLWGQWTKNRTNWQLEVWCQPHITNLQWFLRQEMMSVTCNGLKSHKNRTFCLNYSHISIESLKFIAIYMSMKHATPNLRPQLMSFISCLSVNRFCSQLGICICIFTFIEISIFIDSLKFLIKLKN